MALSVALEIYENGVAEFLPDVSEAGSRWGSGEVYAHVLFLLVFHSRAHRWRGFLHCSYRSSCPLRDMRLHFCG